MGVDASVDMSVRLSYLLCVLDAECGIVLCIEGGARHGFRTRVRKISDGRMGFYRETD